MNNEEIKQKIREIRSLEEEYLKRCSYFKTSDDAIEAFFRWYDSVILLFHVCKLDNQEDVKWLKDQRESISDNGLDMYALFNKFRPKYNILLNDIEHGNIFYQTQKSTEGVVLEGMKSPKVFISHASDDKEIILSFIKRVLILGLGLPKDDIVFTSDENYGIEPGGDIPQYIKRNIAHANVVLIMVSHGYKKSEICLNEMGAAWALDRNIIQVLLPDADFDDLGWVINLKKAIKLNDKKQLISLTKKIAELLNVDMTNQFADAVASIDDFLSTLENNKKVAVATTAPNIQPIESKSMLSFAVGNHDRVVYESINKLGEFTIKELQEAIGFKDYHYVAEKVFSLVHMGFLEEIGPKNRRKYRQVIKSKPQF